MFFCTSFKAKVIVLLNHNLLDHDLELRLILKICLHLRKVKIKALVFQPAFGSCAPKSKAGAQKRVSFMSFLFSCFRFLKKCLKMAQKSISISFWLPAALTTTKAM